MQLAIRRRTRHSLLREIATLFTGAPSGAETLPSCAAVRGSRRPILLLHGFASSARMMHPLERSLRRATGREVICVPISPGLDCLRRSALSVERVVDELASIPGFEYADIVAHSMGGLVATYLLKRLDRKRRLRCVITLGTPHKGTPLAALGVLLLGPVSAAVWQMLPKSALVRELASTSVPEGSRLVSVAGTCDRIVPASFSLLSALRGQENLPIDGTDHFAIALSRSVHAIVAKLLEDGREIEYAEAA